MYFTFLHSIFPQFVSTSYRIILLVSMDNIYSIIMTSFSYIYFSSFHFPTVYFHIPLTNNPIVQPISYKPCFSFFQLLLKFNFPRSISFFTINYIYFLLNQFIFFCILYLYQFYQ